MAELLRESETGMRLYELKNAAGMRMQVSTFGARIVRLYAKNRDGIFMDVTAGFDDLEQYRDDHGTYFGAVVGRVCNRIGEGRFELNGVEYTLALNDNGINHLHGGDEGFDKKMWSVLDASNSDSIRLGYISKDMEEGYPGNLSVVVTYRLTAANAVEITYDAMSDKDTLCSLTNHAYFNLDGDFESVLDHEVWINSSELTVVDDKLIPHGEIMDTEYSPYDFSAPKRIGEDIGDDDDMLLAARGYDFNYVLKGIKAATAYSPRSGILMTVTTDRPCLQFYTGNFLDGFVGKHKYNYQSAFCLETQGYPNACNVPTFKSTVLKAGERYHSVTTYAFETR